ncbi:MAG: DNA translocase FtsK 4TM domain-containing protein, partial [Candidatus Magasanikbacteria bacterium]|nr:DNA translocase FtsK 4TM domain-containing protein [Candidatus Magasanikbacteria bacterium]
MPRPYHHHSQRFDPELSRGIIGIVLVIVSILFVLSFLEKAGAVGIMLDEYILSFLFGSMRYATPAIILILAFFYFKDIEYNYRKTHGIGAILFFLSLSSLFHIGFNPTEMWTMALEGNGGGIFGMLAWPMKTYLGSIASVVVLVGMAAVSVFLIFNTALAHFVLLNKKLFAGLGLAGQTVINLFKLFVKTGSNGIKINGEFEEYESEDDGENVEDVPAQGGPASGGESGDDEDEEADVGKQRAFVKKAMTGNSNGDEENTEIEEEALRQAQGEKKDSSPWTKRVIIKNLPPLSLLTTKRDKPTSGDIEANAQAIQSMLSEFGIEVEMGEIRVGPAVTQYSLKPAKGVKLSRITSLSNDLALALAAHPIRIEAPIPGKSLVGIEVPNFKAALVTLKELLESREFAEREHNLMIALGKDVAGKVWFADLPKMPHLLVAGATGSG